MFKDNDRVLVLSDGSYLDGIKATLYDVDEEKEYGHVIFEDKVWLVSFYELNLLCKKHPRYQAKRKPISNCETCLRIWEMKNQNA